MHIRWADESSFVSIWFIEYRHLWGYATVLLCSCIFNQHRKESLHFFKHLRQQRFLSLRNKIFWKHFFSSRHSPQYLRIWNVFKMFQELFLKFKTESLQEEYHYWFKTPVTNWWTVILILSLQCFTYLCFLLKHKCFKEFVFCK